MAEETKEIIVTEIQGTGMLKGIIAIEIPGKGTQDRLIEIVTLGIPGVTQETHVIVVILETRVTEVVLQEDLDPKCLGILLRSRQLWLHRTPKKLSLLCKCCS